MGDTRVRKGTTMTTRHSPIRRSPRLNALEALQEPDAAIDLPVDTGENATDEAPTANMNIESSIVAGIPEAVGADEHQETVCSAQPSGFQEARLRARIAELERQLQMVTRPATRAEGPPSLITDTMPATHRLESDRPINGLQPPLINTRPELPSTIGTMPLISPNTVGGWMTRKITELPEFSGLPEDWTIFYCAFTETNSVYGCTDLENNQRLVKALKGDARETVKSLLIHPRNVNAVINQLRFCYGRPEQLVRSQLQSVRDVQPIQEHNLAKIIPFATRVSNLAAFLQSINESRHLANPTLLDELTSKLPLDKRVDWARRAASIKPYPTVIDFSVWLEELASVICTIVDSDPREGKRRILYTKFEEETRVEQHGQPCPNCYGSHDITECAEFRLASPTARWRLVKKYRLCFLCLSPGHVVRKCTTKSRCHIGECGRAHHNLLHDFESNYRQASMSKAGHGSPTRPQPVPNNGKQPSPEPRSQQPTQQMNLSCVDTKTTQLLFRILPVTLYGSNRRVETYALLDEASSVTMIDEVLLKDLGLNGERSQLAVKWFKNMTTQEPTKRINLHISGHDKNKKYELKNVHAVDGLDLPMQTLNQDYLQVINPQSRFPVEAYTNAVPRILIGLDHKYLVVPSSTWETSNKGPYVAVTRLGWDVSGTFHKHQHTSAPKPCLFAATDTDEVHKMVSEYFELENLGVKPTPPAPSDDDIRAQSILNETTVELLGRYQTGLIWKRDNVNLPSSYKMALNRLETVERKMERDKQFAQEYKGMINDYISKGYARRVEREEDTAVGSGKIWYLPHFAVTNPNKPGKIRLVFDAAAKVGNVSLNSELLKGPQHYRPLLSVLFHFREGAVAVIGDIKEMFHQIYVQPQDRRSQRFLWRDGDRQREADVYEMQVMTFGAACSPSAAHHVMTLNAMRHQQVDPRAVKAITDYHYVDDYVDSFATEDEAISVSARVRDIHKTGGFELRRFQSNSPKVVESLGQEGTTNPVGWAEAEEKILGLYWQPATDEFRFNVKYQRIKDDVPTERQFLSLIMSTFDPMGFLSCFTITGKLLLREIWRRNVLWDEPLPKELNSAFQKWRHQLEGVGLFRCPRYYFGSEIVKSIQLHVFTDASESAYAAVAYWRATYQNGDVQVSFVCGKTKCAPMRTMSVPRLELQAAVLGTRLMNAVKSGHCMETEDAILWTDAKMVLRWICSTHRRYKQFVGNRVTEILESTDASQWRWVPTADNVADEATRPQGQVDFSQKSRWMCGPKFLQQP
ncbi:uncharacterized protein LOC124460608 [Drosophila willistoni]|uniref:uncharacterized protein LOC124460608 n=1 Tax=Drosophila willistoni TaxID=7260 RepID=UPI001F07A547|nr:uncharacterized protein LOC124460608 [Drosophila willistoni]